MIKIDCKGYADAILDGVANRVSEAKVKKKLAILSAGNNPASASYMRGKLNDAVRCGIECRIVHAENHTELVSALSASNADVDVGGIIVQLPLPEGFDDHAFVNSVAIKKDVDGFRSGSPFLPCTPEGIMHILHQEMGDPTGMTALVIGRGELVGKPISKMLLDANCTVTVAHSKTKPEVLRELLHHNDIVICAAGRAGLVDLKQCGAQIVIDASINRNDAGKLCGDCYNFDPDDGSSMRVTTVPGGVGLLTRAMLMKHMGDVHE